MILACFGRLGLKLPPLGTPEANKLLMNDKCWAESLQIPIKETDKLETLLGHAASKLHLRAQVWIALRLRDSGTTPLILPTKVR